MTIEPLRDVVNAEGRAGWGFGADASQEARGPEPIELPDALIGQPLGAGGKYPDHAVAKAGDAQAAARLVSELVTPDVLGAVRASIGNKRPTVVPVHVLEAQGENQIPAMLAGRIAGALGLPVGDKIVQSVRAKRSALWGHRLAVPSSRVRWRSGAWQGLFNP